MEHLSTGTRAGASLLLALLVATPSGAIAQEGAPPSTVTVMTAKTVEHVATTRLPGRIKASTVAEIRPQVSGIISERLFEEGGWVEAGQPLYKIEDGLYVADAQAADAAVAQAQASYDLSVLDANRAEDLFSTRAGSAAARDQAVAARDQANAALSAAKAQLARANIDLERTTITSPVSGAIGLSQATIGSLVAAQQANTLSTVRSLDPVYVDVTQSVNDLLDWDSADASRTFMETAEATVILPNGEVFDQKGQIRAAEPQVEPTTGMITLRISVPNPDFRLLPGLYVEVEMPQAEPVQAVLVPQSAVMRDTEGNGSVWVVENGVIAVRPVAITGTSGSNWVTTDGLVTGDQIVTTGFQKAGPGAPVQIIPTEGAENTDAAAAEQPAAEAPPAQVEGN